MQCFPQTVILRHRKENLNKCSLKGLESRSDCLFFTYPNAKLPQMKGYIMLAIDGEPLSEADFGRGLFLLDSTWRYTETMTRWADGQAVFIKRSLPHHFRTAYPRRQDDCQDPDRGLASIEALYLAYRLMGRDTSGLLDYYYWKEAFLQKNNL